MTNNVLELESPLPEESLLDAAFPESPETENADATSPLGTPLRINWLKAGELPPAQLRRALEQLRAPRTKTAEQPPLPNPAGPNRQQRRGMRRFASRGTHPSRAEQAEQTRQQLRKGIPGRSAPLQRSTRLTTRVLVTGDQLDPVDELCLLGALRELKYAFDNLSFRYATSRPEVMELARGAWFLRDVLPYVDAATFRRDAGDDYELSVTEPDPLAIGEVEKAQYDAWHAAEVATIAEQQASAEALGVKDLKLPVPDYAFHPQWGKTHGYLHALATELGLAVTLKAGPITPFASLPARLNRTIARALQQARLGDKPFLLCGVDQLPQKFTLLGTLTAHYPEVQLLPLSRLRGVLADSAGTEPVPLTLLAALAAHPRCLAVTGEYGTLPHVAWGAGQRNIFTLYSGANPQWEGAQSENSFFFDVARYPETELPDVFAAALRIFRSREVRDR